jgi:hypothetical protein
LAIWLGGRAPGSGAAVVAPDLTARLAGLGLPVTALAALDASRPAKLSSGATEGLGAGALVATVTGMGADALLVGAGSPPAGLAGG